MLRTYLKVYLARKGNPGAFVHVSAYKEELKKEKEKPVVQSWQQNLHLSDAFLQQSQSRIEAKWDTWARKAFHYSSRRQDVCLTEERL